MSFIAPIEMEHRRLFFWRSPEFGQKNRFNFGGDLFFGDHLKIRRKVCHFPCLFWTAQNQRSVIFEESPGPLLALGAPAPDSIATALFLIDK